MASKYHEVLLAVETLIEGITFAGGTDIPAADIKVLKALTDNTLKNPGIGIAPYGGVGYSPQDGVNNSDDIWLPVTVIVVAKDNQDQTANFATYLEWWEQILGAIVDDPRLGSVTSIIHRRLRPLDPIDVGRWLDPGRYIGGHIAEYLWRRLHT